MHKKFSMLCLLACFLLFPFSVTNATIIPIDLNDFWADYTVTVAPDGSSATMLEDLEIVSVLLSNDPYFGDPGIAVTPDLAYLSFTYDFFLGENNDDSLYALVFDGDTGDILHDLVITQTSSEKIIWGLSGLDPSITLLGLEFQLNSGFDDYGTDSYAIISNVYLAPIPEPSTMLLLGSGLVALLGLARRRFLLNQ